MKDPNESAKSAEESYEERKRRENAERAKLAFSPSSEDMARFEATRRRNGPPVLLD